MPAVLRGAGRGSAKARSKSSASPSKGRAASTKAGAGASPRIHVSPKLIAAGAGLAVMAVAAIVLATDHHAERLARAARDSLLEQTAAAGLRADHVRLDGASAQASADILRAAAVPKGAPLLGLDLDAVRQRIQQVGWVKAAHVMRLFPDSVLISVDERKLMAVWQHDGRTGVIDNDGVVAPEADPGRFAGLPLVVGEGANDTAQTILGPVMARPRLAQRLDALVRVDQRRWDLRLKDGSIVQLPAADQDGALVKLDQLDQQSRILDLGFSRIDLRDPEMVAVRPRQAPAAMGADGAG
ncbi:MAG TPA: cell division protein FtsQ/DivIB [Caulobacteraceae bacterium]|jgi:cell division protein FtsQ|nr:cell division protein FtsQ/DivIB [Caulobacteraceae bacterium]